MVVSLSDLLKPGLHFKTSIGSSINPVFPPKLWRSMDESVLIR